MVKWRSSTDMWHAGLVLKCAIISILIYNSCTQNSNAWACLYWTKTCFELSSVVYFFAIQISILDCSGIHFCLKDSSEIQHMINVWLVNMYIDLWIVTVTAAARMNEHLPWFHFTGMIVRPLTVSLIDDNCVYFNTLAKYRYKPSSILTFWSHK